MYLTLKCHGSPAILRNQTPTLASFVAFDSSGMLLKGVRYDTVISKQLRYNANVIFRRHPLQYVVQWLGYPDYNLTGFRTRVMQVFAKGW